ncbi:MAG: CGNR zinc finger domain-containing protein [Pyrinomonadaceae bacterium]
MSKFFWIANTLALDLANTLAADENGRELDLLTTFDDLLEWVVDSGCTTRSAADTVKNILNIDQKKKMVELATGFRREMKAMAKALANGKPVPRSVIARINEVLREKQGHFELIQKAKGYDRRFQVEMDNVTDFVVPAAESAMDLLCYGDPKRVKKCEGSGCVLYFYDSSKPGHRRWCSMTACGNRAKAAQFYEKSKK